MASLYPYLILIGISIIIATLWLLGQARRRARITNELVALNEKLEFDLPDFLRYCWKPLSKAGFKGVTWRLDWFGSTLSRTEGTTAEVTIERRLEVEDIKLVVQLHEGARRFEQRYFSTTLSESFFLLLYTDMWVKLGTVQGAFAQTAKLNVFLQHDMKNIVQLISLMADQLQQTPPDKERKLIESLRKVMPTLQERSQRFLNTLSSKPVSADLESVNLCDALNKTAEIHNLHIEIEGEGSAHINQQSLASICDNIFGNYTDQARRYPDEPPDIHIAIRVQPETLEITIRDIYGKPCLWPERLFEPFWSEKGDGLGIGLYHARQLISGAGGTLQAIASPQEPLIFVMSLPRKL